MYCTAFNQLTSKYLIKQSGLSIYLYSFCTAWLWGSQCIEDTNCALLCCV